MSELNAHHGSDASDQSPKAADSAVHARNDAGFSHVGDNSTNAAWSQMTGGKVGALDGASVTPGADSHAGQSGSGHSIDFAAHGDIYASSANVAPGSGDQGKGDGSAGDGRSGWVSSMDNTPSYGADNHAAYDPKTSKLDGSKFYDLSESQMRSLPESKLDQVNMNNVTNMEDRAAALGDRMPNVMFRGAGNDYTGEMDRLAQGQSNGDEAERHYAISKTFADDPATRISDMAANMGKAASYAESSRGNLYAFAIKDPALANGARSREHQPYAPEPFVPSANAAEKVIRATPENAAHIATFHHTDLHAQGRDTPLPSSIVEE